MGATTHRHPSAPHIGVLQQYYYIPQPLNITYPQQQQHPEIKPSVVTPNQTPPPETENETTPNDKNSVCCAII